MVLNVLCFGVEFLCCLHLMYVFIFKVLVKECLYVLRFNVQSTIFFIYVGTEPSPSGYSVM